MQYKAHIVIGIVTSITAGMIFLPKENIIPLTAELALCSMCSLITSQLPDLDSPTSNISNWFPLIRILTNKVTLTFEFAGICILLWSLVMTGSDDGMIKILLSLSGCFAMQIWLKRNLKHRGLTHSIFINVLFSLILIYPYFYYNKNFYYYIFLIGALSGIWSHIFYDALTNQGCQLFYPFSKKTIKPLKRLGLRSGRDDNYGIALSLVFFFVVIITKYFPYMSEWIHNHI